MVFQNYRAITSPDHVYLNWTDTQGRDSSFHLDGAACSEVVCAIAPDARYSGHSFDMGPPVAAGPPGDRPGWLEVRRFYDGMSDSGTIYEFGGRFKFNGTSEYWGHPKGRGKGVCHLDSDSGSENGAETDRPQSSCLAGLTPKAKAKAKPQAKAKSQATATRKCKGKCQRK